MNRTTAALALVAAIAAATTIVDAPPGVPGRDRVADPGPPGQPASHAVRGRVKSIGATSLVITGCSAKRGDLAFVLDALTLREGAIAVGVTVSVRCRTEGNTLLATAAKSRVSTQQ